MLVADLIVDCVCSQHRNLELLCRCVKARSQVLGLVPNNKEIQIVLERLIERQSVGVYQYLAEDQCYAPIEYRREYAYFYWFGPPAQRVEQTACQP